MEIPVRSHMSSLDDGQVARVRTRMERDKRRPEKAGKSDQAARRRRRRRVVEKKPEPAEVEVLEEAELVAAEEEAEEVPEEAVEPVETEEVVAPAAEAAEEEVAAEAEEEVEEEAEAEEYEEKVEELVAGAEEYEEEEEVPPPPTPAVRRPAAEKPAAKAPAGRVRIQAEGYTLDGRRRRRGRKKKKRTRVDQEAVQENIKKTLAKMEGAPTTTRRRRRDSSEKLEREAAEAERRAEEERSTIRVPEFLTVAELADLMGVAANQIITSAFKNLGMMVTINQRLDFDQIELISEELGFKAVRVDEYDTDVISEVQEADPERLETRPPVVTVMGHVDHGKTLLLDHIRKTNVIAGEAGGITQHVGAYHVDVDDGRSITFLDTPGHAAFTAMRARGADVTDIVILVVAADDGVMPQTKEAISHAKNAGKPIVVAVNKIDLPAANPTKVKQELLEHEVVIEEFGGDVLASEISAKTGDGIDDLLEKVLLQAELLELQADPDLAARGTVIEAELDKGMGPVATVLITAGTLEVGDGFVCGVYAGRVRAMLDERGNNVDSAGPGMPVRVLGFEGVPQAGESLIVLDYDRAREITGRRQQIEREKEMRRKSQVSRLEDVFEAVKAGEKTQLPLIIKGDTDGSVQALSDELEALSTDEVEVQVIHRAVGAISETDVLLAQTSGAIIIGFHVRPERKARELAEREGVDIRSYRVIYEAAEEIKAALEGMLAPEEKEVVLGTAEVRQLFRVPKVGTVAGCYVSDGVIERNAPIRVLREHVVVYEGRLDSLKRFKDDVKEVKSGYECGLHIENYNDVKVGDVLESYRIEKIARTLDGGVGAQAE
ncbi:MAG: translation initiation factor IF-2 [Gemmatimonadetes bacterium]|uniref:Translation initiation factor IF-2 n=1 Tax=Candidatus Kutchimonas denitrificans TaxID=3056748 RepID=A0AAE5CDP3_9BACT|nr:translation initiation factor IF-2 [Gemmatimonadota bacterium]NIR76214.1 translation initiation factor IF-2 [Candidatus Kutchimonas denitrificans]NIS00654.1 translation initiation factor IF-2 [Gemmatimonadota bacterium]NIT66799.1 translation initiation factor IF-2 [Gemmatimonadota bacterium]NIV23398.1 translation initiation factor IF-2 [Gemmatimonadota bacterium]